MPGWRVTFARWVSKGWEEDPYRPPEKRTWAEKVTDGSNAWLGARRLELGGDLPGAAHAYAEDAAFWRQRGHLARAAISLACAGRCLAEVGNDGVESYASAGRLFLEAGRREARDDPRQALHMFDRARACFVRAGQVAAAAEAEGLCASVRRALDVTAAFR